MHKETVTYLLVCLLLIAQYSFAQRTRYGVGFTPQRNPTTIHGLALGIWDNSLTKMDSMVTINGIHFSIAGFGMVVPLLPASPFDRYGPYDSKSLEILSLNQRMDSLCRDPYFGRLDLNGISISGLGSGYDRMNGIQIGLSGLAWAQNGLMISAFSSIVGSGRGLVVSIGNGLGMYRGVSLGVGNSAVYLKGIQLGIGNEVRGKGDFQVGIFNLANEIVFLQAGVYNSAFLQKGLQIGLLNRTKSKTCVQLGLLNTSDLCSGLQLGIVNLSGQNKGLQLGLVNYTKKKKTLQIGLINVKGKRIRPFLQW